MTKEEAEKLKDGLDYIIADLAKWGNIINPTRFPYSKWRDALAELADYKAAYGPVPKVSVKRDKVQRHV